MHISANKSLQASSSYEQVEIEDILLQIAHSLSAFLSVADQIMTTSVPRQAIPLIFERVDFNARRAEESMRVLRDLHISRNEPATELSQSLTVVVLVADMVVSGHLPPTSLGDEDLFRRNVLRAQSCLDSLRVQI